MLPNPIQNRSYSGKTVSVGDSLDLIPVYSAIQLISGAIASLPIRVYRDLPDGGRVVAPQHRGQKLLDRPTPTMAGDEWRQMIGYSLCTWGNFYAAKTRAPDGYINALIPIDPAKVKVARVKGSEKLEYWVGDRRFDESTMLHIRGMSDDGITGFSPVQQARHSLGMAASIDEFTSKFFANGARPGVILKHPSRLSPEAAERLRAQWQNAHSGANAFSTAVVEEGMDVSTLTMPISDSELVALSKLADVRVAQLFRIPPSLLMAESGGSLTYSTQESETRAFVQWALRPLLVRVENALLRDPDIFSDVGLGSQFSPAFDVSSMLRGDNKSQAETDVMLVNAGILTVDEARRNLGLNPMADLSPADDVVGVPDVLADDIPSDVQPDTSAPQSA